MTMNKNVLVVGGAGYIGSHTCLKLEQRGYRPIVLDNLSNGHEEFVRWGPFEKGDVRDRAHLDAVFARYKPLAVLNFAALIEVGQSTRDTDAFYQNNVSGSLNLISAAHAAGVHAFVFSSTCATYGVPNADTIDETHSQNPINPYGRTKFIVEQALDDYSSFTPLRSVILRYFNAAGADLEGRIGEWHEPETHIVPLLLDVATEKRDAFCVFGADYPTPDGTCIRDYVHVLDLADAHVTAVEYLLAGNASAAINLGTGRGTSVLELVAAVECQTGKHVPLTFTDRRRGDPPFLVADNKKAKQLLGWMPRYDLDAIIASAWKWHTRT